MINSETMHVFEVCCLYCMQRLCVCHPVRLHGRALHLSSPASLCFFTAHRHWLYMQHQYYRPLQWQHSR